MKRQVIFTKNAPFPVGSYSQAVRAGDFIFISGQVPINPITGEMVEGSVEKRIRQVIENLKAILEEAGSSLERIVKISVFLKNLDDSPVVNTVFEKYFQNELPAREMVEVSRIPKEASLEISAIALS